MQRCDSLVRYRQRLRRRGFVRIENPKKRTRQAKFLLLSNVFTVVNVVDISPQSEYRLRQESIAFFRAGAQTAAQTARVHVHQSGAGGGGGDGGENMRYRENPGICFFFFFFFTIVMKYLFWKEKSK